MPKRLCNDITHLHPLTHQRGAEITMEDNTLPVIEVLRPCALIQTIQGIELVHDMLRELALTQEWITRQQAH